MRHLLSDTSNISMRIYSKGLIKESFYITIRSRGIILQKRALSCCLNNFFSNLRSLYGIRSDTHIALLANVNIRAAFSCCLYSTNLTPIMYTLSLPSIHLTTVSISQKISGKCLSVCNLKIALLDPAILEKRYIRLHSYFTARPVIGDIDNFSY